MAEQSIDLKQLERKVWTSFFEDGLWDMYLGSLLLVMGVGALFSDIGISHVTTMIIYVLLVGAAFLFLVMGKRFITRPRIGHVNFGPTGVARKKKTRVVFAVSVLVGMIAFVIAVLSAKDLVSRSMSMDLLIPAIWVGNMIIVFSLAAYFLRFNRLYLIGVMFAICVPLDIVLTALTHKDLTFVAFGIPAIIVLIMGGVVLARFLRKYSIRSEDVSGSEV
ncbi:hypothetical protein AMJ83_08555 [candidate division WOR_3 bacterium SM23_42]|uniref:Uncharacterized protein n=1 Tax=candidate division WOR_3 bacterium SM23_42 TaxID=1703779 RepID=A0A0S8FQV0_UNCW3|nr:MAG: hypothetical protein AMJ83_08555 [candidate division WOR_3 bacterium SM23_42]